MSTKRKQLPSIQFLEECFYYDPETGDFLWKNRPRHHFEKEWVVGWWARRYGGKGAGNIHTRTDGTISGMMTRIDGQWYRTHRIIYKMMLGLEPPEDVDHKGGDPLNNKWQNLRGGTHQQNMCNQNIKERELPRGISCRNKRFQARIGHKLKHINLGWFDSLEEAVVARIRAEKELHGEFAWKGGE